MKKDSLAYKVLVWIVTGFFLLIIIMAMLFILGIVGIGLLRVFDTLHTLLF